MFRRTVAFGCAFAARSCRGLRRVVDAARRFRRRACGCAGARLPAVSVATSRFSSEESELRCRRELVWSARGGRRRGGVRSRRGCRVGRRARIVRHRPRVRRFRTSPARRRCRGPQRLDCFGAGEFPALACRGDDVATVVSTHLRILWFGVVFECGDDVVEVAEDLLVHFDEAALSAGFGGGDDLHDLLAVLTVLGRNSAAVTNIGHVRQALACGQVFCTGSPQ